MNDKNLLDLYYFNRCEYGFVFQLLYFLAVERQLQQAIIEHADKRVLICERSLLSAKEVYEDSLKGNYQGIIAEQVYDKLFEKEGVGYVYPDQMIILDRNPEECVGEISRLDWKGDEVNTLGYLVNCRSAHKELRGRSTTGGYLEFTGNVELESMLESIDKLVEDQTKKTLDDEYYNDTAKPVIISIEGNVGAGKSTLLDLIQKKLNEENITDIRVLKEPVDEWLSVGDGKDNILELYYKSPGRYAMPFQTLAAWTTMRNLYREHRAHPEAKVIICERSILSSKFIFCRALFEEGHLDEAEYKVLLELYNDKNDQWMLPTQSIYLEADPEDCLRRIRERGREGEEKIELSWLETCEENHERLWGDTGRIPKRILSRNDMERVARSNQVEDVLKWCRQIGNISDSNPKEVETGGKATDDMSYVQMKLGEETLLRRLRTKELNYRGLVGIAKANFEGLDDRDLCFAWMMNGKVLEHIVDDADLNRTWLDKKKWKDTIYRFEVQFPEEMKASEEEPSL